MTQVDYSSYDTESLSFIKGITNVKGHGAHQIFLAYEDYPEEKVAINVESISFLDYFYMKQAFSHITEDEKYFGEVMKIYYEEYTADEIASFALEIVSAGEIGGSKEVDGNAYRSGADTYGPYYYSARFLYQPEIQKYIVVIELNYAC